MSEALEKEVAALRMRAEAAEALLEEMRAECEELRQQNEELIAELDGKKKASAPKRASGARDEVQEYYYLDNMSRVIEQMQRANMIGAQERGMVAPNYSPKVIPPYKHTRGDRGVLRSRGLTLELAAKVSIDTGESTVGLRVKFSSGAASEWLNLSLGSGGIEWGRLFAAVRELLEQVAPNPPSELVQQAAEMFRDELTDKGAKVIWAGRR